ncbi:MAG: hypothetical protein CMJ58_08185 [Planctomycetaceae bacterium]|nr:hypothetical protein [Planctomycetaceae bacterium]
MKTESLALAIGAGFLAAVLGCEVAELPDSPGAGTTPAETDSPAAEDTGPERGAAAAATDEGEALPDPGDVEAVTDEGRAFTANDPVKGRRSRSAGGYLGAVAGARFWAEHQMILNNINYAVKLYQAEHGEFPKSNEEFMARIIRANNIVLPQLPDDQEYYYDPDNPDVATEPLRVRLKEAE